MCICHYNTIMLGKLFGSNARVKILKLFLIHPDKKFYIREISRDLKLQLNSTRRELENLEKFGLLMTIDAEDENKEKALDPIVSDELTKKKKTKRAKIEARASGQEKKYYQVNPGFILFEEIKSLILKAQILYEEDFIEKVQKTGKPKVMILSGFFVNDAEASVDLFLVGRFNKEKLIRLINDLEEEMGREINYTVMEVKEFKYRKDITDVFLYDILERRKIIVINELGLI